MFLLIMFGNLLTGQTVEFDRADDTLAVVGMDGLSGLRVDPAQQLMKIPASLFLAEPFQFFADSGVIVILCKSMSYKSAWI